MTIRTTSKTITFNQPFCLKGVDRLLPPGDYHVVTDEELITGASSGFGRDTAETLKRAGHKVFASMRSAQGKNRGDAEALRKIGIKTMELDVSDDASVEAGAA